MTTIIGVEFNNRAVVLADSRVVGESKIYNHPDMVKIVETGNFIIAAAGDVRALQVVLHTWKPPVLLAKDKNNLFAFMIAKVVPSLKQLLSESNIIDNKSSDDKDSEFELQLIIAVCGQLFEIDSDFAVSRNESGYYGIGSGGDYALGALYCGATPENAMAIAAQLDSKTAEPFIMETQVKK